MPDIQTSEMLARDLERIAKQLRNSEANVTKVNSHGVLSQTTTEYVEFEIEWLE